MYWQLWSHKEVQLWVSSPRPVSGTSLRENIQDFESLSETFRFTRVCEPASFKHRVISWEEIQHSPWRGRRFWADHSFCREYTLSRVNPQSRAFAAIPGGTIIGPVIEVQIVKILYQYGLEIAIPSPCVRRTSTVMISTERVGPWISSYSQCRTQIQCRITHLTSESRRRRILLGTVED